MGIEVHYIHKRDYNYKTNKGLSEKLARNYFKKQGFEVWRGSFLHFIDNNEYFSYHRDKYDALVQEIRQRIGQKKFLQLYLFLRANAGIPDFVMRKNAEFFFAEIKLNNESIKKNQIRTISFLNDLGLKTIIVRASDNKRIFKKELDLETGRSKLVSYIPKLRQKW